ncbi:MAG: YbhB/YbcL family Raf kinase inhibitor-like protein [Acidobacteriota bacterium]|nr:YbhB/YbcL family Raf kinase inhibitor-like protein [Acidobacteriota bacterium]
MIARSITICTILFTSGAFLASAQDKGGKKGPAGPGLTLTTSAFADGAEIPQKFTQSVPNPVSPKLEWTNVPAGTVAFVLHMHDPDVARQKTTEDQLHWMLLNIPGSAHELAEGISADPKLPDGSIQIKNGGNTVGYRGPGAPAAGPHHHYTFELYALDAKVDLGPDATRADVLKALDGHILGKAVLVGRFHR